MQTPARYKTDGFPGPRAKIFLNIVQQLHEILFLYLVFSLKYRRNTSDSIQIRFAPASSFHPLVGSIPFWSLLSGWWSLKSAYIKFLWWLLTFSLCISTPKTSQQQTGTAEASLASRWPCPSASVTLLEDDVMVIAMTSSTLREKKKVPHISNHGKGQEKPKSVQGRVGASFPPQHSHFTYPDWGSSPLRAHAMWRLWLHFCNCMAPDSTGSQNGWGWKGPLEVVWSKSGCLHLCGYYLCYYINYKLCKVNWDPQV